jgi:hypothetical protein
MVSKTEPKDSDAPKRISRERDRSNKVIGLSSVYRLG